MNNKLKLTATLFFITLAVNIVHAQDFLSNQHKSKKEKHLSHIGIKGGVNFTNSTYKNDGAVDKSTQLTTYNAGLVADLGLSRGFSIRTGLDLQSKGVQYQAMVEGTNHTYKTNPVYLELPFNFIFKLPFSSSSNFYFGAGPYLAYGIGGKQTDSYTSGSITYTMSNNIKFSNDDLNGNNGNVWDGSQYKRFDAGANVLAGLQLGRIAFNVQYGIGLFDTKPGTTNNIDNQINEHRSLSGDLIIFF